MLSDFVLETTSAPGTSATITLAGAASGPFCRFRDKFSSGNPVYFTITDNATQSQAFRGTLTTGTPDTLTVVETFKSNAGTTTRLNFTGTCYVSSWIPSDKALFINSANAVDFKGADAAGLPSLNGGPLAGFRNKIINGNFRINQRAYVSAAAKTAGVYMHDRWKAGSGGCTYSFTQAQPDTAITISAGTLAQVIEGTEIEGGTYTLSWAGTAHAQIDGGGFLASPISVTGKTAGTNITVEFNTGTVGKVQFEPGPQATTFERRPITTEQMLCWRYFWSLATPMQLGGFTDTGFGVPVSQTVLFPVTMRAVPTVSTGFNSGTSNAAETVNTISTGGFIVTLTASGLRGFFGITYIAGNSASAEL